MAKYRVWQWGIEIGLGSYGQRKMSSRFIKMGFDSEEEAKKWAADQDKSNWGNWSVSECGENKVIELEKFEDFPKSYKQALSM